MSDLGITVDEWLAEFDRLTTQHRNAVVGISTRELVELTGISEDRVRNMLRAGTAQGRIEVVWKMMMQINGLRKRVPAYRLKKQQPEQEQRPVVQKRRTPKKKENGK